jgi:hypothetical protein
MTCGLIDILAIHHSERPFPPTYIRGKKRKDYMLLSASLQESVVQSGILPYCSIFAGDHHPWFLDLNADILFAGSTSPLAPVCHCSLQLSDPRRVEKYKTLLYEQLDYHKIMEKSKNLYEVASNGQWTNEHTLQYEC